MQVDLSWKRFVEEVLESPGHRAGRVVRAVLGLKDGAGVPLVDEDGNLRDAVRYRAESASRETPGPYAVWSASQRYWRDWQDVLLARSDAHRFANKARPAPEPAPRSDPIDIAAAFQELTSLVLQVLCFADEAGRYPGQVHTPSAQERSKLLGLKLVELGRRPVVIPAESPTVPVAGTERSIASSTQPGEGPTGARRAV